MIRAVEPLADEHEVIVQGGHNHYPSSKMTVLGFVDKEEIQKLYERADVIITHAGAGSMIQALKNEKRTIAVPRLSKYHEHVNDHQLELASKLEALGYLLVFHEGDDMEVLFKKIQQFTPKPYQLKGQMLSLIDQDLNTIFNHFNIH